jgi:hypothetical protein
LFAGQRLTRELRPPKPVEYEAAGNTEEIGGAAYGRDFRSTLLSIPVTAAVSVLFAALAWYFLFWLGIVACLVMGGYLLYIRSQVRLIQDAKKRLPSGPWSVRVTSDVIAVTWNGDMVNINPGDVISIASRPLAGDKWHVAIQVRLRPGSPARRYATDGWLPIYWTTSLEESAPPDLAAALARFARERRTRKHRDKAKN